MVSAAFFDIFGIIVFAIIIYIGLKLRKKKVQNWIPNILIVIGVLGLLVDIYIVFSTFIFGG